MPVEVIDRVHVLALWNAVTWGVEFTDTRPGNPYLDPDADSNDDPDDETYNPNEHSDNSDEEYDSDSDSLDNNNGKNDDHDYILIAGVYQVKAEHIVVHNAETKEVQVEA